MSINRRTLLRAAGSVMGASLLSTFPARATVAESGIDVLLDEQGPPISPDLYGYLLENLGTAIYDGVWVGERSGIPNIHGIRKALVDKLREAKASVIRWPGGNFADYYDWEDGVGPRARRPRRTNFWADRIPPEVSGGPQRFDPNWFGTPELIQLCKLTGGRPFLNANTRSLTPQSFFQWVEYCNSPAGSTTLADARKADGSAEPHNVRYWGLGNEVWAAGGSMSVEEYVAQYKRFTSNVPRYGVDLAFIACGAPPGKSLDWVREFLRRCRETLVLTPIFAVSLHYYAAFFPNEFEPGDTMLKLQGKNLADLLFDAGTFGPKEWYQILDSTARVEQLIEAHWQLITELGEQRRVKLALDEWGTLYKPTERPHKADIRGREVTMRDALAAALTLDVLNRHSGKVAVANFTGLINQEGGLFQADGPHFCTTPVYHVFRMYSGHQGGSLVRTAFNVPRLAHEGTAGAESALGTLSGSASLRGNELTLTVVNPHVSEPMETRINLRGGEVASAAVASLAHSDIRAQNTFQDPDNVVPATTDLRLEGSTFRHTFPAASVTAFTLVLKGRGS